MTYAINDIIYTKDGRKSGNLTIVDIQPSKFNQFPTSDIAKAMCEEYPLQYTAISDYGNKLTVYSFPKSQFYVAVGKADKSHKYHNYREYYPEEFL